MARSVAQESFVRLVSAPDPPFPATQPRAPMSDRYTAVVPIPPGVWATYGAGAIHVDISQASAAAPTTYTVLAWSRTLFLWLQVQTISLPAGQAALRTSIPNWASDYAYVVVSGTTVMSAISVVSVNQVIA